MSTKVFNLSLPKELVDAVDKQAKKDYSTRSDYIRRAVLNQLRTEQTLAQVFDQANTKGKKAGYVTEQMVYDKISES